MAGPRDPERGCPLGSRVEFSRPSCSIRSRKPMRSQMQSNAATAQRPSSVRSPSLFRGAVGISANCSTSCVWRKHRRCMSHLFWKVRCCRSLDLIRRAEGPETFEPPRSVVRAGMSGIGTQASSTQSSRSAASRLRRAFISRFAPSSVMTVDERTHALINPPPRSRTVVIAARRRLVCAGGGFGLCPPFSGLEVTAPAVTR